MKTKNLIIISSEEMGIFLGTYEKSPLWSKHDMLHSSKAYGFNTMIAAEYYVARTMPEVKERVDFFEIPCYIDTVYVDVIDIIKAGYKDIAEELFLYLPTSTTIN
jgi:hypothetical protein